MARPDLPLLVATLGGLGRAPLAPGTLGSLAGLALAGGLGLAGGPWLVAAGAVAVSCIGVWAAGLAEARLARRDPPAVVVDEVAGQLVSLLFLPLSPAAFAAGFLLFRLLDIFKPYPIRRLERLAGGSGIMADDLLAGVYANLLQQALRWTWPGWWGGG